MTYAQWFRSVRRTFLLEVLTVAKGNQLAAAEAIGVHRNTMYRMLREDGIGPQVVREIRRQHPVLESEAYNSFSAGIYRKDSNHV
jgi:hypothetical protein